MFQSLFIILSLFLVGCVNPLAVIKPDLKDFKKDYPDNFGFVEVNKTKIHYAWSGDKSKRPIIFVHGSPGSWEGWVQYLNNETLQKNYHLIALDRPGYGKSQKGKSERSLEKQAQAVMALLSTNESKMLPILVGHSFGGPIIARAGMRKGNKIGGLIFVASSVSPALEKTMWIQHVGTWWPIRVIIPSLLRVCNEEIMSLKKELIKHTEDWEQISAKTIIIHGTKDRLVPVANVDYLVEKLDKNIVVSTEIIPKIGHFIPWERTDLIIDAIDKINIEITK